MRDAERAIAAVDIRHDDTQAVDVDDVRQVRLLALHLQVDAVQVLLARVHARRNLRLGEALRELALDLAQQLTLIALRAAQGALQHAVAERVERLEAEILELDLQRVDAEPVRYRGVDVERLPRDPALFLERQRLDRAHVVRAVGELHEDHAQVFRHREQHLAEALGLRLGRAVEAQVIDLADAVYEQRDVFAEAALDVAERARGVLEHVVQQRGFDRARVEVQPREDFRDGYRVSDVRVAAAPLLALVSLRAVLVRGLDAGHVRARQVRLELPEQAAEIVGAPHRRKSSFDGGTIIHGG